MSYSGLRGVTYKKNMDFQFSKTLCLIYCLALCEGLYFDANCSSTYNPTTGIITTQETSGTICVWKFIADTADTFVLEFIEYRSLTQLFTLCKTTYLEVKDGSTDDSPAIVGPRLCYIIQPTAQVFSTTNGLWIKMITDSFSQNNQLTAMVRIDALSKRYKVYTDELSWLESHNRCTNEGGILAVSYPTPTTDLEHQVFMSSSPLWTGKSVTDWVWLLGCVTWNNVGGKQASYHNSKYNQMAECATMCRGALFFLLQKNSCYCFNKEISMESEEFRQCDFSCPGNPAEKCGGENVYTQYQFSTFPVKKDGYGTKNCAALTKSGDYVAKACDILLPFSCTFENDTYSYTVALPWYEAIDYCSKQNQSLGLSTVPQISSDFFEEPMWLGLIRGVDWGFPSVIKRDPERSFLAVEGLYQGQFSTYMEELANTSQKSPFVCQFDRHTCGTNVTTLDGNITSPNYPETYGVGSLCVWTISRPDVQLVFIIEFLSFNIENSPGCIYDFIQFTQVLGTDIKVKSPKHCGDRPPAPFVARTNHIEVTFRSDRSVTSTGFAFTWRLVNDAEARKWEEGLNKPRMVNGGLVIGLTIACTFLVIFVLCVVFVVYRARKKRLAVIQEPQGSVNNAIYGMDGSEFDETSVVNDNFTQYENVNSPNKILKEEVSYNYENVEGGSIAVGVTAADITSRQSKENLIMDMNQSDDNANDNDDHKTHSGNPQDHTSKPERVSAGDGVHDGIFLSMSDVDNIGKDAIQVVETTELADTNVDSVNDMDDDYIPIDHDMKKNILKDQPNDEPNDAHESSVALYTKVNKAEPEAHLYQYTTDGTDADKGAINQNYVNANVENDETDEYEEMDGRGLTGPCSPGLDTHGPLIPQVSSYYAEIEETSQLKK